ncbi:MAG: ubiquinol-cytochrome c reductase iron-sulfur subunit [Solirubrobacterales bacterium]|jgi:ubiquinol-cytochrome c reductase iron-sulfur subunit|nr:ubiquinol-cytochrome c reductase iron-sulfur subunit [Solirubrobacterales bacterium]
MTLLGRLAFAAGALRGLLRPGVAGGAYTEQDADPRERRVPADPRAEALVAALLVLAGLLAAAFGVLIAVDPQTQLLGLTFGLALAALAAALIVAGKRVVVQEIDVEPRKPPDPADDERLVAELRTVGEGISRRRALAGAAGVACAGLAGAVVLPITALGPSLDAAPDKTPWKRGRRLVTPEGRPLRAADLVLGSFASALPEGADKRELGSPVVVVRVDPGTIRLPAARRDWAPQGILAFSQICTHAGCAITLFRYPVDEATSNGPALVCPCHYSTFDVRRAARPIFGPAARALPQLPLAIDASGVLVAAGALSGSVGPSWWGVKS